MTATFFLFFLHLWYLILTVGQQFNFFLTLRRIRTCQNGLNLSGTDSTAILINLIITASRIITAEVGKVF